MGGQNLAVRTNQESARPFWEEIIKDWFSEVKEFLIIGCNPAKLEGDTCNGRIPADPGVGHFTQVVWGDTTHIGCGWSKYEGYEPATRVYGTQTQVVCNYGPSGNYKGEPLYPMAD